MAHVAGKLAKEDNVVGFDTLNEPNMGLIGRISQKSALYSVYCTLLL